MNHLCRFFQISRQAVYRHRHMLMKEELCEEVIIHMVQELRQKMPRLGGRKLYHLLKRDLALLPVKLGRDTFFDLLRKHHLLIKSSKRYAVTTQSRHRFRVHTNLLKDLSVIRPNQVLVADITYLRLVDGFCYLFLLTDVYSRKIVGYHLSKNLAVEGALRAARIAFGGMTSIAGLIHHSDRGIQYCCDEYVRLMNSHGAKLSMGETGNPYDNAIAERVNGILKTEFFLNDTFNDFQDAHRATPEAIEIYNNLRPHMSIGYMTPAARYAA